MKAHVLRYVSMFTAKTYISRRVVLPMRGGVLILEADSLDWCAVHVKRAEGRRRIGAEGFAPITKHILRAIKKEKEPVGEIDGSPVVNIFNVCEPHASLYLTVMAQPRKLYIQDVNLKITDVFEVSVEQLDEWKSILERELKHKENR